MTVNSENPYLHIPSDYIEDNVESLKLNEELLNKMNSPDYYTVYPPICQIFFAATSYVAQSNFLLNSILLKLLLLVSECLTFLVILRLLQAFDYKSHLLSIYAFNPLVVIEIMGNAHLEGVMVLFLLSALILLVRKQLLLGSVLFSCAIAVKMLPLLLVPAILKYLPAKARVPSLIAGTFTMIILFLPFYDKQIFINILESVNLYFQKFEFNASIYYLAREIGFIITDRNLIEIIGATLGILTFVFVLLLTFKYKIRQARDLVPFSFLALLIYFALATTIHPWYLITVIALSVFVPYRTGLIWSAAIILSYFTYMCFPYKESLILVTVEYLSVYSFFLYEFRYKKTPQV